MAAAVTNPFKLTYGSFVCGGTSEVLIDGMHSLTHTHDAFEVTLDVIVRGTSDATFATNCAALETAFATRRQSILFEVGSSTIQTFNPASGTNTGLNCYASASKVGTPGADTDRSRLYRVTVGCELPSTDTAGRRDIHITVDYTPAKQRTVTFDGVWTALTSNLATAQYLAQIDSYCSSALSALTPSGTFEAINGTGRTDRDDQDHTLTFSRQYREIIVAQPSGSLDNATIVEPEFSLMRTFDADGDSGNDVKRLTGIVASFSCWIDKTASTDIDALYRATVRPYMISQMTSEFSPSQYAIVHEETNYDPYTNRLRCSLVFQAAITPKAFISVTDRAKITENSGVVLTGAWTGQLFGKYRDQGIARRLRFASRRSLYLGDTPTPPTTVGSGNEDALWGAVTRGQGGGGNWALMDAESENHVYKIGQPGGNQITVSEWIRNTVEEYYEGPKKRRGVVTGDAAQGGGGSTANPAVTTSTGGGGSSVTMPGVGPGGGSSGLPPGWVRAGDGGALDPEGFWHAGGQ